MFGVFAFLEPSKPSTAKAKALFLSNSAGRIKGVPTFALIRDGVFQGTAHGKGYKPSSIQVRDVPDGCSYDEMLELWEAGEYVEWYRRCNLEEPDLATFMRNRENWGF